MKKIISHIIFLLLLIAVQIVNAAEVECPIGLVNDTSPGQCGLYNDENSNELCDLSEPHNCTTETDINNPSSITLSGEQLKTMTVEEVATAYGIDKELFASDLGKLINTKVAPYDSLLLLHDNNGLGMSDVKAVATSIASGVISTPKPTVQITKTNYYLLPIILISTILYLFTFVLSKKNIITLITHRKIWNWLLLVFFVATTFFAMIWILNAEYALGIRLPINTSYWHIITGLVMIMISIFHIWWHLNYYFVKKKK
jgi:hypothetical protein